MADSRRSAIRSISRQRRNQRKIGTTNDEPYRWSTWRLNRRLSVAKHHPRLYLHRPRNRGSKNRVPSKCHLRMAITPAPVVPRRSRRDLAGNLRGPSRITPPLVQCLRLLLPDLQRAGHWAQILACHQEATHTANQQLRPLPRPMRKAASRNPKANNTPFPRPLPSQAPRWANRALRNRAHSQTHSQAHREGSRYKPSRKGTGARTRLVRPWEG